MTSYLPIITKEHKTHAGYDQIVLGCDRNAIGVLKLEAVRCIGTPACPAWVAMGPTAPPLALMATGSATG